METIIVVILTCINSFFSPEVNAVDNSEAISTVVTCGVDGNGNSDTGQIRH